MNIDKAKVVKAKTKKVLGVLITYCILVIVAFIFFMVNSCVVFEIGIYIFVRRFFSKRIWRRSV